MEKFQNDRQKTMPELPDRQQQRSAAPWKQAITRPCGRFFDKWQNRFDDSIDKFIRRDLADAELLLAPHDLRTRDPSLMREIEQGHFGVDGMFVNIGPQHPSVFAADFADECFNRALLGFGWLRDLRARGDTAARHQVQEMVFEWIDSYSRHEGLAYEPMIIADRVAAFLSNGSFLLRGLDNKRTRRFMRVLVQQVEILHFKLGQTSPGLPQLLVLGTLVMAGLCLSEHADLLEESQSLLLQQLQEQVLADGGHYSRNPQSLLDILFRIMPLKQCYRRRGLPVPEVLENSIARMVKMTRFLRLGDSSLARFNGQSATPTNALATLLVQEEGRIDNIGGHTGRSVRVAPHSAYCRLQDGPVILLADIGSPPPVSIDAMAHAGCLSFEMSVRHFAMVVNSGAYSGQDEEWQRYARSTRAHSTLSIDNYSSGGFLDNGHLLGPDEVVMEPAGELGLSAVHNGFAGRFGLRHKRRFQLSCGGLRLEGVDELLDAANDGKTGGAGKNRAATARNETELVFHIRFHLHPFVEVAQSNEDNVLLTLPDGEIWRFHARGAGICLEDAVYLAYRGGIKPAHQIRLHGPAVAGTRVSWLFEQYRPRRQPA